MDYLKPYKPNDPLEDKDGNLIRNDEWLEGEYQHYKVLDTEALKFRSSDGEITGKTFHRIMRERKA